MKRVFGGISRLLKHSYGILAIAASIIVYGGIISPAIFDRTLDWVNQYTDHASIVGLALGAFLSVGVTIATVFRAGRRFLSRRMPYTLRGSVFRQNQADKELAKKDIPLFSRTVAAASRFLRSVAFLVPPFCLLFYFWQKVTGTVFLTDDPVTLRDIAVFWADNIAKTVFLDLPEIFDRTIGTLRHDAQSAVSASTVFLFRVLLTASAISEVARYWTLSGEQRVKFD